MELVYKLVIFIIWQVQTIQMASFTDVQTLYTHLTTGRDKYFRPQSDYDQVTDVTISFTLFNLQDINAVEGTISFAGYFTAFWKDENLVWTPGDYNNIELMTLPHDQIWKPPLINSNSANEMKVLVQENTFVQLYYNGSVMWLPGQTLKFICDIDTTYFPFDIQECQFLIISWGFPMDKITFTSMDKTINTASFRINSEWDLTETSVSVDNSQTPTVKYTMIFKRRPLFLLTTFMLPTVFMALLNIFVFCLPQESGERIGFVVTFLLAVVVFMTIAKSLLPATAMPRLSAIYIILMISFLTSAMIIVSVIVSAWFYYKTEDESIPVWIQRIVQCNIPKCKRTSSKRVGVQYKKNKTQENSQNEMKWHDVARFWDRLSFFFYFLCFIGGNSFFVFDVIQWI